MMSWWALAALAAERPNLVLLSLDTTRADALSCYGVPAGPYRDETRTTPAIDALAAEGIRFEQFFAHAPSTLSSHTSMMTGLDPHGHAVVRNGFPVDARLPTLAERLAEAGWDTVAVLGSSALERAMGLDRGFRLYDDAVTDPAGGIYQARADDVVARTLAALDSRPDPAAPLFLFAHFYDPHAPYDPPEPYRSRFTGPIDGFTGSAGPGYAGPADPNNAAVFRHFVAMVHEGLAPPEDIAHVSGLYLGEVAFMDAQVGALLSALQQRGLLERALVVVVADHGETLADDPLYAWSHGSNVATEVMRVPLVMKGFGLPLAERAVVQRQAGMDGLAPTLLELLGLPSALGDGLSFADWVRAGPVFDEDGWPERPTVPVYLEATRPRFAESADQWNNLYMHRGVWAGGWGIFSAPFLQEGPRFFDLGGAPHEELLGLLQGMVQSWDGQAPPHTEPTPSVETTNALKALGYTE